MPTIFWLIWKTNLPRPFEFYDIYKGEALGLRAYMHFDLLRLYADQATDAKTRGIVYNTAFSLKPSDILPKTKSVRAHYCRPACG